MNGKETKILQIVSTDVKWMKSKQINHDKILNKLFTQLEAITGKISDNREDIGVLSEIIGTHKKLFYGLFTAVVGLISAYIVSLI